MESLDLPHVPCQASRILVIKFRHHGDMLLTTPVIHSLKAAWPHAQIDVLLYEETRAMLGDHPDIHQIYAIDRRWKKQGVRYQLGQEWRLMNTLRKRRYDIVINLADQWRSAIITRFTGARVRLGFDFPKRQGALWKRCHTQLVSTAGHSTQHTVEQNLSLLAPLKLPVRQDNVRMHYSTDDREEALRLAGAEDYIVVQPTSRWFFKCWSEDKFAAALQGLVDDGQRIVLTSGPDSKEIAMVDGIIKRLTFRDSVISLAGQLTLTQLAALIDGARLFIGVDSVPMHMAAALQTPTVALFGPSKLVFWRPWQVNGEVIWAGDYASLPDPDSIDTKTGERYLDAIPPDVVLAAARRLLQ